MDSPLLAVLSCELTLTSEFRRFSKTIVGTTMKMNTRRKM